MIEVINRTISFAGRPPLTPTQQGEDARSWSEVLIDLIPENRLHDCLKRAAKDHDTPFAINMHELKTAWQNIFAEEKPMRDAAFQAEMERRQQELIDKGILKSSPIISQAEGVQIVRDHLAKLEAEKAVRIGSRP